MTADIAYHSDCLGTLRKIDMTDIEDRSPPAIGAYWIKEEDYAALLSIFPDGNKMPPAWKDWLKIAEEMKRGLEAYGHVAMRVYIRSKYVSGLVCRQWLEPRN
jgi:hypothetical protein